MIIESHITVNGKRYVFRIKESNVGKVVNNYVDPLTCEIKPCHIQTLYIEVQDEAKTMPIMFYHCDRVTHLRTDGTLNKYKKRYLYTDICYPRLQRFIKELIKLCYISQLKTAKPALKHTTESTVAIAHA